MEVQEASQFHSYKLNDPRFQFDFELIKKSQVTSESGNNVNNVQLAIDDSSVSLCSSEEEDDPVTIDLTGPLPVVHVFKRNGTNSWELEKKKSAENNFKRFVTEAPKVPVMTPIPLQISTQIEEDPSPEICDISDIDLELFDEGKYFIQRNLFSIIFAHLVAIAFLLGVKPIQALLLRTGAIHQKENTLKRYLSLIWAVRNLYECDLVIEVNDGNGSTQNENIKKKYIPNIGSKTSKELEILRKAQGKIAKNFQVYVPPPLHVMKLDENEDLLLQALKADLSTLSLNNVTEDPRELDKIYTTINPDVPLSQYDMAMVQFAFFGFVSLFPQRFGIHETELKKYPKGLQGFIHVWGVLGKRLGLEDRFNLCLKSNVNPELNLRIFNQIFLFSFKMADENLIKLWRSMTAGSSKYCFFFRTKSLLQFMLKNVAEAKDSFAVAELMNCFEKLCYYCYSFCVNWLLRFWMTRKLFNSCTRAVAFLGYKLYLRRIQKKKEKYEFDRDMVIKSVG